MSNRRNPTRLRAAATAKVVGSHRPTTMSYVRDAAVAYRAVAIRWVLVAAALFLGVVAAGAHSIGYDPTTPVIGTGAALAAVDLTTRFPSAAATTLVVFASSVMTTPVAAIYAIGASGGGQVDQQGAIGAIIAMFVLTGLLAHRTSRTKPWLTVLLVAVGVMFVGPFLVLVAPLLGFAWAWLVMITVLLLRGGGGPWAVDQWQRLLETASQRRQRRRVAAVRRHLPETANADSAGRTARTDRADKKDAQVSTADLLAGLPAEYTVFHNRTLRDGCSISHIVVGPTGVFVIEPEKFRGRIHEDPTHGLTHKTINVAALLNDADALAALTAREIRLDGVSTYPTVVIHQAVLPVDTAQVALTTDGSTLGTVTITTASALLDSITTRPPVFSDRKVRRIAARVNRMCPPATSKAVPAKGLAVVVAEATVLDEDGRPKAAEVAAPLFVSSDSKTVFAAGQQVTLLTDQGTYDGYVVTGDPAVNDTGLTVVPVRDATHNGPATDAEPEPTWFPLDSVQAAETTDH